MPWPGPGRRTPGGVRPRTPRGPSTSASRGRCTSWPPRPRPCGPGWPPPRTRWPGCTPAWPPPRSWPTGTGSRSRRTASRCRRRCPAGAVAVAAAGPAAGDGARSAVRAEIVDRVEQVLRAAGALDAELAALLTIAADTAGPDPSPRWSRRSAFRRHRAAASRTVSRQRGLVVRAVAGRAAAGRRRAPRVDRQPRRDPGGRPRRGQRAPARRAGRAARRRAAVRCRHATTR